jgi:hypothetical protein
VPKRVVKPGITWTGFKRGLPTRLPARTILIRPRSSRPGYGHVHRCAYSLAGTLGWFGKVEVADSIVCRSCEPHSPLGIEEKFPHHRL